MNIELTQEEVSFILQVLDRTQLSGVETQRVNLRIVDKLSFALQSYLTEPVKETK